MLWILRKTPHTNRGRAAVIFWMLWLLIHIVIFSMTSGVIHPYYVVVMAPAVAALVGISLPFLWGAYTRRKPYAWLPTSTGRRDGGDSGDYFRLYRHDDVADVDSGSVGPDGNDWVVS